MTACPQFSLKSLFIISTLLMVYIALLTQLPVLPLLVFAVPSAISLTAAVPYLLIRLFALLADKEERTLRSAQLQRVLWALVTCAFVSASVIAFAISSLFKYRYW